MSDNEQTGEAPIHTNRLIDETSPYLLQHAHNPVDWYPWGPEGHASRYLNLCDGHYESKHYPHCIPV
jgi:hypothetical protein